jgi:hypothetical protein
MPENPAVKYPIYFICRMRKAGKWHRNFRRRRYLLEMFRNVITFLLGVFLILGCATRPRSTPDELGAAVRRHTEVGLNHVFYMGSRGGDHFLLHQYAWGTRVYRISSNDLIIDPIFPYTRDTNAWRLLTERWWPEQTEGHPLVFQEQTPQRGGDVGTVRMSPVQGGD